MKYVDYNTSKLEDPEENMGARLYQRGYQDARAGRDPNSDAYIYRRGYSAGQNTLGLVKK